ncbi:MAG: flagellar protein FlaG [Leptospirales bacterium]|nr:flagellar protein FlaG [Leptospirales bacterium]
MENVAIDRVQSAHSQTATEGMRIVAARRSEEQLQVVANPRERQYRDVLDTPENRERIGKALGALETVASSHGTDAANTRYQFKMHAESGRLQVALVNFMTGETIEEIPSEKVLDFANVLDELSGLIINKEA